MKTNLFNEWMGWFFSVVEEFKKVTDITKHDGTYYERLAAFMYERFFNVWLNYQIREKGIKISYKPAYKIECLGYALLLKKILKIIKIKIQLMII